MPPRRSPRYSRRVRGCRPSSRAAWRFACAGSANFRNKADIGLSVWRDITLNDPRVQVHITKVRYQDQGQLGAVQFGYDAPSKRIYEIGKVER